MAIILVAGSCSRQVTYPCDGRVPADAVVDMGLVIGEFRSYLAETDRGSGLDRYFSDYHHYDLRITVTDSEYVYTFLPSLERPTKGGGARYVVSRKTGEIEGKEYFK